MCVLIGREAPHILVNNAAVSIPQDWDALDEATFTLTQQIDLVAPTMLCQAAIAGMRKRGWGRFVGVSALPGPVVGRATRASFGAAKAGFVGMHLALAAELAADGILVNCVAPGFVETDAIGELFNAQQVESMIRQTPVGRLGRPDEVAALVAFLAGPNNTYMTAQHIIIDGGYARTL
jgi:NAD(P)-dependent dehydrogenase (short-subunit alcohol dehydrogenase family)